MIDFSVSNWDEHVMCSRLRVGWWRKGVAQSVKVNHDRSGRDCNQQDKWTAGAHPSLSRGQQTPPNSLIICTANKRVQTFCVFLTRQQVEALVSISASLAANQRAAAQLFLAFVFAASLRTNWPLVSSPTGGRGHLCRGLVHHPAAVEI